MLLLSVCISVDYADDSITVTVNQSQANVTNCTMVGGVHYSNEIIKENKSIAKLHKIVTIKPKYPLISMWAKPSVRSSYSYRWYKKTFINYCPHCHHYGVLLKNPKRVPENEYTCRYCDSDYCAVTGKEKYSWSKVYLRRA